MTDINDIIKLIPIDQVAEQLGTDPETAKQGIEATLPALVGGMEANVAEGGGESLTKALQDKDPSLVEGGVDLSQVDTADGEKIVKNVFGDETDKVISALGGQGGGGNLIGSLLPMLAPIVMSFLAKQMGGGGAQAGLAEGVPSLDGAAADGSAAAAPGGAAGMGSIEDILGGLLGGGQGGAGGAGNLGGLGDLLGGLLGGGKR